MSSQDVPFDSVESLPGGCANFCWRVKFHDGRRSIIKHAEDYIRVTPEAKLSSKRLDYECAALRAVAEWTCREEYVRVPSVYRYYPKERLISMLDGGIHSLEHGYVHDKTLNIPALGARVGTWLARLHNTTSRPEELGMVKEKFDNRDAKRLSRVSYRHLGDILERYGHDPNLGEQIDAKFGSKLDTDEDCLTHGDCWPGNFFLEDQDEQTQTEEDSRAPMLTVADWELVQVGNGSIDVGHFAAQAWLLDRYYGDRGLMSSFLAAYVRERPLSQRDKIRVTVHFGAHICFHTPTGEWTDEKGTEQVVEVGKDMLEGVHLARLDKLRKGPLKSLFEKQRVDSVIGR